MGFGCGRLCGDCAFGPRASELRRIGRRLLNNLQKSLSMKMHSLCPGDHVSPFVSNQSRRDFLQIGAVAGLGLTLPGLLKLQAGEITAMPSVETYKPVAQSIIHIFLPG